MRKAKIFIYFGLWVAFLPYLGFPAFIKNALFSITGFIFVYIGLVIRSKLPKDPNKNFDNFSENL